MKKLNNSNFELIQDVIKDMKFNYDENVCQNKEILAKYWEETVGKKISKFSRFYNFSNQNLLTIICADSFVSNELYFEKENLLKILNSKTKELGITIKDINFDYKKWKEQKNE